MTMNTATIYAKATLVLLGQLLVYTLEKNWGLLLASLVLAAIYNFVIVPEAGIFHALVFGPEGLHATGQRVFGVISYR